MKAPDPRTEPVAWLRWAYRHLDRAVCSGCTACADKCAGALGMWREEAARLHMAARAAGFVPKPLQPGDEWSPCPFLDAATRLCRVYQARPLVCRIFGLLPWLPCPLGRVEPLDDDVANEILIAYTTRPRRTYWQWLASRDRRPRRPGPGGPVPDDTRPDHAAAG